MKHISDNGRIWQGILAQSGGNQAENGLIMRHMGTLHSNTDGEFRRCNRL